jgi:phage gpG-like protein
MPPGGAGGAIMAKQVFGFSQGRKTTVKLVGAELQIASGVDKVDVLEYLNALHVRAQDLQRPLQRFGAYLVDVHIPRQFAAQGTPKRWAALSPKYAAWKRRHYGALPKLVLTGAMQAGFRWKVTPRSLQVINQVKVGQRGGVPRWTYHQLGTETMPARPLLQITKKDRDQLRQIVNEWLTFETGGGVL